MVKVYKYQVEQELKELESIPSSCFQKKIKDVFGVIQKAIYVPKEKKYFCTNCRKWHDTSKLKPRDNIKCKCGAKLEVLYRHYNVEPTQIYLTDISTNKRDELILRIFFLEVLYDKLEMQFYDRIVEVERINYDRQICLCSNTYRPMGYYGGLCHSFKKDDFRRDRSNFWKEYPTDNIITKYISKRFKKSKYKYYAYEYCAKYNVDIIDYTANYNNTLETLVKCGGHRYVRQYIQNQRFIYGTNVLHESKYDIKRICKYNFNFQEYLLYKDFGDECDPDVVKEMAEYGYKTRSVMNSTGDIEWKQHKKYFEYIKSNNIDCIDYCDYLNILKKMRIKLDNKNKYPKDFVSAHSKAYKEVKMHKNKFIDIGMKEVAEEMEQFNFNGKNLCIKVAMCQDELINESAALNHCVRTYAERISNKATSVFFIRRKDEADIPFVTLELKNGSIVQCRAKNNDRPDEEVISFVNLWAKMNGFSSCFG